MQSDLGIPDANNADGQQVYVADSGDEMDAWSWLTGQEQASSTTEIAQSVAQGAASGVPVTSVELKGHGSPGCQKITADSALRSPLTAQQRQDFANIGASMDPGGVIILAGCNVAEGDTGIQLMREVASASQRTVTAGTAVQLPLDGIEGTQVYVYPDGSVKTEQEDLDPLYDAVANGSMEVVHDIANTINAGMEMVDQGIATAEEVVDAGIAYAEGVVDAGVAYAEDTASSWGL